MEWEEIVKEGKPTAFKLHHAGQAIEGYRVGTQVHWMSMGNLSTAEFSEVIWLGTLRPKPETKEGKQTSLL